MLTMLKSLTIIGADSDGKRASCGDASPTNDFGGCCEALGMSVNALAKELRIPTTRLNDIVRGRRGVTADTALRLARYLGNLHFVVLAN